MSGRSRHQHPLLSVLMDKLRERWGGRCVWWPCGGRKNLEFAHLKPTKLKGRGRGGRKRYFDIVNHPECYVLLCRGSHALFDGVAFDRVRLEEQQVDDDTAVPF